MASPAKGTIAAAHFSPDALEFIRLLGKHRVEFVIVGGEAVIYHGYARFTGDVDFFYRRSTSNTTALYNALREFWGGRIPSVETVDDLREAGVILQFGRPPNRIDLLNEVDGVTFDEAWNDRETVQIEEIGATVAILGLDTLLKNKQASGRAKDLEDLQFLLRLKQ